MPDGDRWQRLIRGLRQGDRQIVQEFCAEYGEALERLAEKLRRRVGPEDVVQSVCRTFLRRARAGPFQFADSAALWRVLCAITLTKVREQIRFHLRQKRGLGQETNLGLDAGNEGGFDLVDPVPTPEQATATSLPSTLDEEARRHFELAWRSAPMAATSPRARRASPGPPPSSPSTSAIPGKLKQESLGREAEDERRRQEPGTAPGGAARAPAAG
jgi:hypothetical protein